MNKDLKRLLAAMKRVPIKTCNRLPDKGEPGTLYIYSNRCYLWTTDGWIGKEKE